MKKNIKNLNEVLSFQLEGMYGIIKHLQTTIPVAVSSTTDTDTKSLLRSFSENLDDQRLKLKRAFGYLLNGPYGRKSGQAVEAIVPFREISEKNVEGSLRDILFTTSMHATILFIITSCTDSRYIAMRLEMDKVVALLDEMIDLQESFLQKIRSHFAQQINNACLLAPVN